MSRRSERRRSTPSPLDAGDCAFFADPVQGARIAPVFWLPGVTTDLVVLTAAPAELTQTSPPNPENWPQLASRQASEGEYVLLEYPPVQLWWTHGAQADKPLAVLLPLDETYPARAAAAEDLWRVFAGRPLSGRSRLTRQRRERLILGLRALDGRQAGASYRVIASVLFGADRVPAGRAWKTHDLRSRTLRLVAEATALMKGGYLDLLRSGRLHR